MSEQLKSALGEGVGASSTPVRYRLNPVTDNPNSSEGEVALVGAGPGDPELLTLKAWRLITSAEVVLYDRLVSEDILAMVPETAQMIHVGKQRANHTLPQDEINRRLVELARKGHKVVRLKGGDPFIFGRGGEEIETLAAAGVRFQVVPGITAASGCAAYAGIPLTHRDHAQSVRFITGHLKNDTCDLPWKDFVQNNQTLVFYMGLVGLPVICRQLISHGMPENMPVALVSKGTTREQVVVTGNLATIVDRVNSEKVQAPTLIIIGHVVSLRGRLDWVGGLKGAILPDA
jgi:uroporphyrin-III C-methyltransferase/precorrin-2 dehydrogenase/sirohydrochlorin ferrochelatase/uroporphyrin-III C-methyltransferase